MIILTKEKVIELHTMLINQTGGADNVREMGLLESALEGPFATFGASSCTRRWAIRQLVWVIRSCATIPSWTETSELAFWRCWSSCRLTARRSWQAMPT